MARRTGNVQPHWSQTQDYGPLFTKQTYKLNYTKIIEWARDQLLRSDLETFTADDVRRIVETKRPHWLGSGRWIGLTFDSPLFEYVEHAPSDRPAARGRQIMRYRLTEGGQAVRARLHSESPTNPQKQEESCRS